LHSKEYLKIVAEYFGLPDEINAFNQFEISKELISTLSPDCLNKIFVDTMKMRDINNLFFNKVNCEFNQICLSMNLKKEERDHMISNLRKTIT
jgi:hypothetical protein